MVRYIIYTNRIILIFVSMTRLVDGILGNSLGWPPGMLGWTQLSLLSICIVSMFICKLRSETTQNAPVCYKFFT